MNEYLVVVPASDLVLFEYLEQRFKGDPATSVLVDRRKTPRPAPAGSRRAAVLGHGVTVVRLGESPASIPTAPSRPDDRRQMMNDVPVDFEDRQRVDRWLEESQYLLGRLIQGYLDDRDRLKTRLAASVEGCQRKWQLVVGLRREVAGLVDVLLYQRNDKTATEETFFAVQCAVCD